MTKRRKNTNGVVTKDVFKLEVESWAKQIGVEPKEVHIRLMKRKWGSCSTTGRLTFDTSLLEQTEDFRKEVIVHEVRVVQRRAQVRVPHRFLHDVGGLPLR